MRCQGSNGTYAKRLGALLCRMDLRPWPGCCVVCSKAKLQVHVLCLSPEQAAEALQLLLELQVRPRGRGGGGDEHEYSSRERAGDAGPGVVSPGIGIPAKQWPNPCTGPVLATYHVDEATPPDASCGEPPQPSFASAHKHTYTLSLTHIHTTFSLCSLTHTHTHTYRATPLPRPRAGEWWLRRCCHAPSAHARCCRRWRSATWSERHSGARAQVVGAYACVCRCVCRDSGFRAPPPCGAVTHASVGHSTEPMHLVGLRQWRLGWSGLSNPMPSAPPRDAGMCSSCLQASDEPPHASRSLLPPHYLGRGVGGSDLDMTTYSAIPQLSAPGFWVSVCFLSGVGINSPALPASHPPPPHTHTSAHARIRALLDAKDLYGTAEQRTLRHLLLRWGLGGVWGSGGCPRRSGWPGTNGLPPARLRHLQVRAALGVGAGARHPRPARGEGGAAERARGAGGRHFGGKGASRVPHQGI